MRSQSAAGKCGGVTAGFRAWTPEEDKALRDLFGSLEAAELAQRLGRTTGSVFHRAQRLGVKKKRGWTKEQDVELRSLWESGLSVSAIARRLDRTPLTTYWRARKIGLRAGCPDGFDYLSAAATRCGYDTSQLWRIMRWAGKPVRTSLGRPTKARRRFHIVDTLDVDEAVEAWHETEPLEAASRRLGIDRSTLRRWLFAIGVTDEGRPRKVHWRVRSEDVARAVAARAGAA